jgi:hypothetical protein
VKTFGPNAHDQSATSAPGHGLGFRYEFAREPVSTLRAVDPERVDLTAFSPPTASGTRYDPAVVVADEGCEVSQATKFGLKPIDRYRARAAARTSTGIANPEAHIEYGPDRRIQGRDRRHPSVHGRWAPAVAPYPATD